MKVAIGESIYTAIKKLTFAPEADVSGSSLPINTFTVDIMTDDDISIGAYALLYDDLDKLWAKYWITYAERVDAGTVRVEASSTLVMLERTKLGPAMYSGELASTVVAGLFGSIDYTFDSSFASATITGYCPEQTARERLQWVCFVIGAYVRTFFAQDVQILPIDETEGVVPLDKTFWKPKVTYSDYVTAVRAKAFSYEAREPQTKERWVEVGGSTYVQTEQWVTLANPDVPPAAPENVVELSDVTLVHSGNVSAVLSHLSKYYFKRGTVEFDAVNNADWEPGQKLVVSTDGEGGMSSGYVSSCSFTFGLQARSRIVLESSETKQSAGLTIRYLYGTAQIGMARYYFPVGYEYDIENPYIDMTSIHRYVFRPLEESAEGTMTAANQVDDEGYAIALEFNDGDLRVVSVDSVEVTESQVSGETIKTAVIA